MLTQCVDVNAFTSYSSRDRYVRCIDFIAWQRGASLVGIDVWGDSSQAKLEQRARVLDHLINPSRGRRRVLFDSSGCRDASPAMFRSAAEFWCSRRERHAVAIGKLALVVTDGYVGALVLGLTQLLDLEYPVRTFKQLDLALAWLDEAEAPQLAVELRGLRPTAPVDDAVVDRLQQLLSDQGFSIELSEAARKLGMSSRTLQRRLTTAGTTFQDELLRTRLTRATTLMLAGSRSLTAIALDLGFASLQHFSSRFTAVYGDPPSTWLRNYQANDSGRPRISSSSVL